MFRDLVSMASGPKRGLGCLVAGAHGEGRGRGRGGKGGGERAKIQVFKIQVSNESPPALRLDE